MTRPHAATYAMILALCAPLGACTGSEAPAPRVATAPPASPGPAAPPRGGPVLDATGACTGPAPGRATAIEPGIGECDLVNLKGHPPTDVLIGEGRAGREVQVLYAEPGARELYFFVENRLDRIVR